MVAVQKNNITKKYKKAHIIMIFICIGFLRDCSCQRIDNMLSVGKR